MAYAASRKRKLEEEAEGESKEKKAWKGLLEQTEKLESTIGSGKEI